MGGNNVNKGVKDKRKSSKTKTQDPGLRTSKRKRNSGDEPKQAENSVKVIGAIEKRSGKNPPGQVKGKNNNAQIANETQARNILAPSTEELQIKKSLRSRMTANDPGMVRSNVSGDKIVTRPAPSGENSKGETSNSASQPLSDTLQDKEVNHVRGKHSKTATTDNNTTDSNDNYRDTVMLDVTQSDDECFQDPHNAVDPRDLNEYDDFTSSGESTDSGDNSADDSYSDDDNSSSESDSQGLSETSTSRKTDLMGRRQITLDPAIKLMMGEMVQEGIRKGIEEYSKKKTHG